MRVVVIGAGLLGLVTAYFLRRHGLEVCVVDRRTGPGLETSFANGGMLHASQANPWNAPGVLWTALRMLGREDAALLVRPHALPRMLAWAVAFVRHSRPDRYARNFEKNAQLARYSIEVMRSLREQIPLDYDYVPRGTLKLFRTAAEFAAAAELSTGLQRWRIRCELLDAPAAVGVEPALAPIVEQLAGGLYFPEDEAGDAYKFCVGLTAACRLSGVEFRFDTAVTGLRRSGQTLRVLTAGHDDFTGDKLVLAAGSYTPLLAKTLGLKVPVQPVKGYSITVPSNGWLGLPQVPVIDDHLHAAVCPLGGRLRVAGTAEFTGYDLALTPSRIANLFDLLGKLYPGFTPHLDPSRAERWTGLRPMSCDGVGIMGATAVPNVYLNTGHGPLGWTMAAGAGKLVADQIAGQAPALDSAPYALARFA